jgi:hypothetical protein
VLRPAIRAAEAAGAFRSSVGTLAFRLRAVRPVSAARDRLRFSRPVARVVEQRSQLSRLPPACSVMVCGSSRARKHHPHRRPCPPPTLRRSTFIRCSTGAADELGSRPFPPTPSSRSTMRTARAPDRLTIFRSMGKEPRSSRHHPACERDPTTGLRASQVGVVPRAGVHSERTGAFTVGHSRRPQIDSGRRAGAHRSSMTGGATGRCPAEVAAPTSESRWEPSGWPRARSGSYARAARSLPVPPTARPAGRGIGGSRAPRHHRAAHAESRRL